MSREKPAGYPMEWNEGLAPPTEGGDDTHKVAVEMTYTVEFEADTPAEARAKAARQAAEMCDQMDNRVGGSTVGTSNGK